MSETEGGGGQLNKTVVEWLNWSDSTLPFFFGCLDIAFIL